MNQHIENVKDLMSWQEYLKIFDGIWEISLVFYIYMLSLGAKRTCLLGHKLSGWL